MYESSMSSTTIIRPSATASPGDLLERPMPGLRPRPTESETWGWGQQSVFSQTLQVIPMVKSANLCLRKELEQR